VVRGRRNPRYLGLAFRLKRARNAACLSFDSVAESAGLTDGNTVFQIERKAGHVPRLDTVEKIATALDLSPGFLAFGLAGAPPRGEAPSVVDVGQRLRSARLAQGLSVLALARLAAVSHTGVANIERGTMPTVATIEALANALSLSPAGLAYGIGDRELPTPRKARTA
jgi:transcriptional regulator with XRE-family HTH domain